MTIARGAAGSTVLTGTPVGGYAGIVTFMCGTLLAGASCSFAPASLVFTGSNTAASATLTFSTVTSAALDWQPFRRGTGAVLAVLFIPFAMRRRKLGRPLPALA